MTACPDENRLLRVALGTGSDAELSAVEAHLDGCVACRRALAAAASATPPAPSPTLQPGERVGRYTIEAVHGVGAMGVVYAAHDAALGRRVALKLLRDGAGGARLVREAQAMARLAHENVVPVFDLGERDGRPFLAMELVEGATLREWLATRPAPAQVLRALVEAGRGLAAAHAAGLVHRDFKPDNVLMGRDGRARVTDFGLARDGASEVEAGALLGTLAYMAPEQVAAQPATARSDQFAWCVALAEGLTGRRPFRGATAEALVAALRLPPDLAGVPRGLRAALQRGLDVDPAARFDSMDSLLQAIQPRRRWMPWVAAGGVLAALAGWAMQPRSMPPDPVVALHLHVGASTTLDCPGLQRVALSDPKVIETQADGDVLRVTGVAPGHATLNLWERSRGRRPFDVTVEP